MEKAGKAMQEIHGKLTPEKVDETMFVAPTISNVRHEILTLHRDVLRDQNALSEEIVNAITGNQLGEPIDDAELEDELEQLQQEQLDEQMLKTGNVPVSDAVHRMPTPANTERESPSLLRYRDRLYNIYANREGSDIEQTTSD